jgi:Family of unknown function (DUF6390)
VTQRADAAPVASGPVLFAQYAYPPNSLGYCGPGDPAALLEAATTRGSTSELAHRARQFEGAWPYLELIAACNGIGDPLDRRVVEAYWVGNELARRVPPTALAASLAERFERRAGRHFDPLVAPVGTGGVPQHSFHVFAVYPWLGLLRAGMDGPPLEVLDRCRIRWGRVEAVQGDVVSVRGRHLGFDGSRLTLEPARSEEVRCAVGGAGFVTDLRPGDVVSIHWDWVCDRLTPAALGWLRSCTRRNLDAVNTNARPGPAVVCEA